MPKPEEHALLLRCFSERTRQAFAWMTTNFGCLHSEGYSRFDVYPGLCSLRQSDHTSVPSIFDFIVRFTDQQAVLELHYGDRELIIELSIVYPMIGQRFCPTELLRAASVPSSGSGSGGAWVHTQEHINRLVSEASMTLQSHWPLLREIHPKIIDRALELRGQKLAFDAAEQRRRDRESACIRASRLFHQGDFAGSRSVLLPYLKDVELGMSSRKLYELASKRL